MSKPEELDTLIFVDSSFVGDTQAVSEYLRFDPDGETTNPSLIKKHPDAVERLERGDLFATGAELLVFYRGAVTKISNRIPHGSVSVEVLSDETTSAEDMFRQGTEMNSWIPNAHVKYPTTKQGLQAARWSIDAGMNVNMTLCFNQEQAAAVHAATLGAEKGQVFVSPFIGRLDDIGQNGMDLVANIAKMYREGESHVEVLAASTRKISHIMGAIALGADIITAPPALLKEWSKAGMPLPKEDYDYSRFSTGLKGIPYDSSIDLRRPWTKYNIDHELTDKGVKLFAKDWQQLVQR